MKRTCNNCRALDMVSIKCNLGFKIHGDKMFDGLIISYKPLEQCPKPKTMSEYIYLYNLKGEVWRFNIC